MAEIASRRWHKMNSTICEIERLLEKQIIAKDHCAKNKNSIVAIKLLDIEGQIETLFESISIQCDEWKKKFRRPHVQIEHRAPDEALP